MVSFGSSLLLCNVIQFHAAKSAMFLERFERENVQINPAASEQVIAQVK